MSWKNTFSINSGTRKPAREKEWHLNFQKLLAQNFNLDLTAELLIQDTLHLCLTVCCVSIRCADRTIFFFRKIACNRQSSTRKFISFQKMLALQSKASPSDGTVSHGTALPAPSWDRLSSCLSLQAGERTRGGRDVSGLSGEGNSSRAVSILSFL